MNFPLCLFLIFDIETLTLTSLAPSARIKAARDTTKSSFSEGDKVENVILYREKKNIEKNKSNDYLVV